MPEITMIQWLLGIGSLWLVVTVIMFLTLSWIGQHHDEFSFVTGDMNELFAEYKTYGYEYKITFLIVSAMWPFVMLYIFFVRFIYGVIFGRLMGKLFRKQSDRRMIEKI